MTQKRMMELVRATGCSVRVVDGEIQIRPYPGAPEEQVYYTNDREDAVNTARAMKEAELVNRLSRVTL